MLLGGLSLARLFEGLVGPVPVADQLAARRVQQVLYVTTDLGGGSPRRLGVLPDNEGRGSSRVIIVITVNMSAVHTHYTLHVSSVRAAGGQKCGLLPVLAAELPPGLGLRASSVDILHPGLQRDVLPAGYL